MSSELGPRKRRKLADRTNLPLATPPTTPLKNKVIDLSSQLKRNNGVKKLQFDTPPTTPTKPKRASYYSGAKALFQKNADVKSMGSKLVGREDEAEKFVTFMTQCISELSCNSLYISGPPGTGKSAQVSISLNHLMSEVGQPLDGRTSSFTNKTVRLIKVNCMSISHPDSIFHEIYCEASKENNFSHNKRKTSDDLYNLLLQESKIQSIVVILDEMDCLITKDQQVLYQLFNFASPKNSKALKTKLVLVGISNALDLTDKFLPRLKRNGLSPQTIQFLPYTSEKIRNIIINKLNLLIESEKENLGTLPLFHPAAILLCCKKSASVTGDLRKALDICYKSIELVEMEFRRSQKELSQSPINTYPRVLISHVAKVCSASFGDNSSTKLKNHNLLQKAVLCCLFNYYSNNIFMSKDITVNAFFDYYNKHILQNINNLLSQLNKGEFLEIISALESSSVISLTSLRLISSPDSGSRIIKPNVPYDELNKSISDVGVLQRILHSNSN